VKRKLPDIEKLYAIGDNAGFPPEVEMPSRREIANAIRALSMDAVQRANSGHPGMPMGMADIAEVLWRDFLKHNPGNPRWADRDRFVLSNGHGSMLLYSVLHLTGYPLGIDELKNFRQLGARTAGHPEHEIEIGIETTTGPLGQGLANAVGLALAEKKLALAFNRPGHDVVDHYTWVFLGDGCLMEGISHEACSIAGTWGLGKLICFYDDNGISIDGEVAGWFTDDTPKRFEAYGWQVIRAVDGHDPDAVARAIRRAQREKGKPTLICCKTIIGYGAPNKQGKEESHGAALGADEVALARKTLNWPHEPFVVPDEVRAAWDARAMGKRAENRWRRKFKAYEAAHPELAAEYRRRMDSALPAALGSWIEEGAAAAQAAAQPAATRQSSQAVINGLAHVNGSDEGKIERAIDKSYGAFAASRVSMRLSAVDGKLVVEIGPAPEGAPAREATVWLAPIASSVEVPITRGENRGKTIVYSNVARGLFPAGTWNGKPMTVRLDHHNVMYGDADRCAVLLQQGRGGPIVGAALLTRF